jgi:crotonobetainyl-CoA:carnitine CoA-transferase CaiB-like acyl-CoA transferase
MPLQSFKDLVVVELASVLAGPSVGMFFAELGARVIKIENSAQGGDVTRSWRLPSEKEEITAYFSAINYQKEYLDLDLKKAENSTKLDGILNSADILLTNFKKGSAEKIGLGYDVLHQKFPFLIVGQISGFKSMPHRTAYDVVVQAETGFMHMNGSPNSGPIKMPVALMDVLAAHHLKEGLLIALLERAKTGKGCFVETNLEQAGIASLANQASNFLMQNHVAQAMGSQHPNIAPYGDSFVCKDQKAIVLAVGSDAQFVKMLQLLGAEENATLTSLSTNLLRVQQRKTLNNELAGYFERVPRDEILVKFIANNIPAGAIRSIDEVFNNPAAIELIREEEINGQATKRVSSIAFTIS